jgi:Rrf2 family protein
MRAILPAPFAASPKLHTWARMAFFGNSVEYGLHTLLWLAAPTPDPPSGRDLAELQNLPPALLAKVLAKLEKAGIVTAAGGVKGGYRLARAPGTITMLEVVDAIEGKKKLFDCKNVRSRCLLFGGVPQPWATEGVCNVHAQMLEAEKAMRANLATMTIGQLAMGVVQNMPQEFAFGAGMWLATRAAARKDAHAAGVEASVKTRQRRSQD